MNEKQRWLLADLDAWQRHELEKIGRYEPRHTKTEPMVVRAARRAQAKAQAVIDKWKRERSAPWEKEKKSIGVKYQGVKRVILFESTANALKAIKALK